MNKKELLEKTKALITKLRRNKSDKGLWGIFEALIEENIADICGSFDTRRLISVCDTYVDYGNPIEKRNALLVSQIANFEKIISAS